MQLFTAKHTFIKWLVKVLKDCILKNYSLYQLKNPELSRIRRKHMSNNILHSHDVFLRDKISFKWQQAYAEISLNQGYVRDVNNTSFRQLLAYGGTLRYSVAFYASDGIGTSNLEPQVLIKGGRTRKQVIYVDAPAPENGVRQEQEVGMKEVSEHSFHITLFGLGILHVMKS